MHNLCQCDGQSAGGKHPFTLSVRKHEQLNYLLANRGDDLLTMNDAFKDTNDRMGFIMKTTSIAASISAVCFPEINTNVVSILH